MPKRKTPEPALAPDGAPAAVAARPELLDALQRHFGMPAFKPGQAQVIDAIMSGRSAAAIFPTGGGKSLCYQLPALLLAKGLTVVVSPLIALMKDQVDALRARGHAADMLGSMLSLDEKIATMRRVRAGETRLLYVAPEQLNNESSRALVTSRRIALLAIDEAHCISEWGHAFRPDYLRLAVFARECGAERVLALTATATPAVARDIREAFGIAEADCVRTTFHRPNLRLGCRVVAAGADRDAALRELVSAPVGNDDAADDAAADDDDGTGRVAAARGPTIVYCTLQRTTEEVARMLSSHGVPAKAYHAGLANELRSSIQNEFMQSTDGVIVATIAFGMGVDKPDIRRVVHYNLPKSLEGYAQEIGRAGRDGRLSRCDVLACADDTTTLEAFARCEVPSERAVSSALHEIFFSAAGAPMPVGAVREVSHYSMARAHDPAENALRMLLAFVDIYGRHLQVLTPKYAVYQLQPKGGGEARAVPGMLRAAPGASAAARDALATHCVPKQTWAHVDLAVAAAASGVDRAELVAAITALESTGKLAVKASHVVHCYRILSQPDVPALARAEWQRLKQREARELGRIDGVLRFLGADKCQARLLMGHFGEAARRGFACGAGCERCRTGARVPIPPRHAAPVAPSAWQKLAAAVSASELPADDAQLLVRFAFGYSSPRISQKRLTAHALYGSFVGADYDALFAQCEALVAAAGRAAAGGCLSSASARVVGAQLVPPAVGGIHLG